VYGSVISTIGNRRRAALTESFIRINSFSLTSNSARALPLGARHERRHRVNVH
jgi:hypothetical protein